MANEPQDDGLRNEDRLNQYDPENRNEKLQQMPQPMRSTEEREPEDKKPQSHLPRTATKEESNKVHGGAQTKDGSKMSEAMPDRRHLTDGDRRQSRNLPDCLDWRKDPSWSDFAIRFVVAFVLIFVFLHLTWSYLSTRSSSKNESCGMKGLRWRSS